MDNTKLPAHPQPLVYTEREGLTVTAEKDWDYSGFSKIELASLMIAQGMVASGTYVDGMHSEHPYMAQTAVSFAKAVLEEANK